MTQSGATFSFSLYTILLEVILVIYFRSETGSLEGGKLLESSEAYHH